MENGKSAWRVLLADDDLEISLGLKRVLTRAGYEVEEAVDGPAAAKVMEAGKIDAAIIDPRLPGFGSLSKAGNKSGIGVPCIMMGDVPPDCLLSDPVLCAEVRCIPKPFAPDTVLATLDRLQAEKRLDEEDLQETRYYSFNKSKYRILYEHDDDQVFFVNPDGFFLDANEAGCSAAGFGLEELRRRTLRDVRIKDLQKIGIKPFKRAVKGEEVNVLLAYTEKRRGRLLKDIRMRLVDLDGQPAVLCRIRDLSSREKIKK
jgi:PAS domain S-box-containing protein